MPSGRADREPGQHAAAADATGSAPGRGPDLPGRRAGRGSLRTPKAPPPADRSDRAPPSTENAALPATGAPRSPPAAPQPPPRLAQRPTGGRSERLQTLAASDYRSQPEPGPARAPARP